MESRASPPDWIIRFHPVQTCEAHPLSENMATI